LKAPFPSHAISQYNYDNRRRWHVVQGTFEVSDDDIRSVIENFLKEVSHADPKVRKSAVLALFEKVRIFPKKNEPWERILEIKGSCLPLTRVSVASPRGFEPLLSRLKSGMSWTCISNTKARRLLTGLVLVASPRGFEPLLPA
jgi:hypothetical protein